MEARTDRQPAPAGVQCFHCGELVPPDCDLSIEIDGQRRAMCCPGCRAVAALVSSSGLTGFYRRRTAFNDRPVNDNDIALNDEFQVYDEPDVAASFSSTDQHGITTASVLLGGVNCAACTWLIEQSLADLTGVEEAMVNLQHSRLNIRFDANRLRLSELFTRLAELGYRPRPYERGARREQLQTERRDDLRRLSVAGLGMMQVGMFAIALHAGDVQGMDDNYRALLRWVSLPIAGLVVIYSARPFFATAWRHLKAGALVMDTPVALAIGLAFAASAWATLSGSGQVYFDSVVMFTFFLLLGRFLEKRARQRNTDAWLNAGEELPTAVTVMREGTWETMPRLRLRAGDEVLIRAGETVPIDAVVLGGQSMVREDFFSGEHLPRHVASGATIYAGTLNLEENLRARTLGSHADTRLAAMHEAVELGTEAKPRLVRIADRIAGRFVAAILLLACATMLAWLQIAPDRALWVTLSVLVISCPCALALATPAALASAATALRRRGVLVRGENALEGLPACTHLLFDKTGTLTLGRLRVARVQLLGNSDEAHVLAIGAALQVHANHPLADAFIPYRATQQYENVSYTVGAGLQTIHRHRCLRMGSESFCRLIAPQLPPPPDDDRLWIALCEDARPLAWIGLDDPLRGEAREIVATARRTLGLRVELLTGDSSPRGPRLAAELGMDASAHGLSPEEKMSHVRDLQRAGARVCMVGDGLNDAPVLALADVSFAMAGATDLARNQADLVIVEGGLQRVMETWSVARRCRRIVIQNFAWALTYNLGAIPAAAAGLVPPWAAAIGMSLSSLLVVGNSLRLNRAGTGSQRGAEWKVSIS